MKFKYLLAGIAIVLLAAYLVNATSGQKNMNHIEENTKVSVEVPSPNTSTKQSENIKAKNVEKTQAKGNSSASHSDKMNYSDNWCSPYEDLSEDDLERYKLESREWSLSTGMAFLDGSSDKDYLNSEYLEAYKEEDINFLIELGNKGHRMALIALIQRKNITPEIYYTAAKELVILGDTAMGLQALVMEQLNSARFKYDESNVADETIKLNLINALALVEIGLQRMDVSALETYLMYLQDKETFLSGLNPDYVLNEKDMDKIPQSVSDYKEWIEQSRISKNLPSLQEQELPHVAYAGFNSRLATTFYQYGTLINSSRVLKRWHESYLQKTPCITKLLGNN